MVSSLRFLLDYENIEDEDDSDASDNDDDEDSKPEPHVVINREAVYKVHNIIIHEFYQRLCRRPLMMQVSTFYSSHYYE